MVNLIDLGFSKNVIAETVVSTYNTDGEPNAAPMGVILESDEQLAIRVFNSSQTSHNLRLTRFAVVNITSNIEVFYKTAFKEANPNGKIPPEWFKNANSVDAPQLCMADAAVEVVLEHMEPINSEKSKAVCKVKQVNVELVFPKVPCRAFSAALEAIVHATRVKAWISNPDKSQQINKLLELIANCTDVVERTASNSSYFEVMKDLNKRVNLWRMAK